MHELSRGLVESVREQRAGKLKRTFVSGSEAASCKINRTSIKRPADGGEETVKKVVTSKYGNFVAASSSDDVEEKKNTEGFILPPKRSQLSEVKPSENHARFGDSATNRAKENIWEKVIQETGGTNCAPTEKERRTYRDRKGNIVVRENESITSNNFQPEDRNGLFAKVQQQFPPQMTNSLVQKYTIAEEDMNQRSISLNINDTLRLNENELTKNWKIALFKK